MNNLDVLGGMVATYTAKVVGVTASKGEFKDDDGQVIQFDSTKVVVELPLRGDLSRGIATEVFKIGKSSAYEVLRLDKVELPFIAEMEVRKSTNGREAKDDIVGFRIKSSAAQPAKSEPKAA